MAARRNSRTRTTSASRATRLEAAIGREVRIFRHQLGMTVTQLAQGANMSAGMLSKIENGQTSPSLATLTGVVARPAGAGDRLLPASSRRSAARPM